MVIIIVVAIVSSTYCGCFLLFILSFATAIAPKLEGKDPTAQSNRTAIGAPRVRTQLVSQRNARHNRMATCPIQHFDLTSPSM